MKTENNMNAERPIIMITNDDGIQSPGLYAAAEAAAPFGDLLIVAPHMQQTGMARAFPRNEKTGIIEAVELNLGKEKHKAYAVHGSPALAVAHGVMELSERKPDLCISGINYGENLGGTITCSGTLGAVFEADSYGIPGIAVSLSVEFSKQRSEDFEANDWDASKTILQKYIKEVLEEGMPIGTNIWNINVPSSMQKPYLYRVTTQSRQNYYYFEKPQKRNLGAPYRMRASICINKDTLEKDSDIWAVYMENIISVTPLCTDMSVRRQEIFQQGVV
ncbi:MAG: 5'/3'-nucleotidase SurE [Lachnospiraceae bacterium]